MKCEEITAALIDLSGEEGDAALRKEIEQHLLTCEKCALDARELNTLLQRMDTSPSALPGPALRENFEYMLRSESEKLAAAGGLKTSPPAGTSLLRRLLSGNSPIGKIAAIFLVLAIGVWIGTRLPVSSSRGRIAADPASGVPPDSSARGEITGLKNEVKEMKEALLFTLLKEESASQRLRAVSYTEDISNPDQTIINALVTTLNHDKNANVRLATLYSLARYSDNPAVRDSLVRSLNIQTEPIVQIVLINLLTEMKEVKAIKPLRDIISNEKTLKEVRSMAEKGLRTL
ncbi:MAG TPA: HEAT repeat domain-containing protein [Puia sp.]|jgi:hypothetical protein|nr:HEAT repeat domain-containing protein [Puia sp.]